MPIKTLQVRVRDKHAHALREMSVAVNQVWNFVNALSQRAIRERGLFLSAYDIHPYTKGSGKLLGLHSQTVQAITEEYVTRRKQFKKTKLRWRVSRGARRALGWVPVKSLEWRDGQVFHGGRYFKVFDSYGLSAYRLKSGSFSEDARGRWYLNIAAEVAEEKPKGTNAVGIDLGCKTVATASDGTVMASGRWYRDLEQSLAIAQRAKNKQRVRAIHAKIKHRRKDAQHKFTTDLVRHNAAIFVGDVDSMKLVKTQLAKSVLDAGWGQLKALLKSKCDRAGVVFEEVSEYLTTQTCSACGALPTQRPKGIAGLGIREWTCDACGSHHDRDINAARNILAVGLDRLAGEKVAA